MSACRVCVLGPSGRMGSAVIRAAADRTDVEVTSAADDPNSGILGTEVIAGVEVAGNMEAAMAAADVYVDFTVPRATAAAATAALNTRTAAVVGTTGLSHEANAALEALSEVAPVLIAPNFSLGVNLILHLAEEAARALGDDFDLEIVEFHHKRKRDAPSGTALALGQALARGRGLDFERAARFSREGDVGARSSDEIGFATVRGGDIVGEHTAYLISENERVEISHRAASRSIFAQGALRAAVWIRGRGPGFYSMKDVLGL